MRWEDDHIERAIKVLRTSRTTIEAAERLSAEWGRVVSKNALQCKFRTLYQQGRAPRAGDIVGADLEAEQVRTWQAEARVLRTCTNPPQLSTSDAENVPANDKSDHMEVVRAVQGGARSIVGLANRLDCSPRTAQERVDAAREAGHTLELNAAGEIVFSLPRATVSKVETEPSDGWERCVFMADIHAGSAHCFKDLVGEHVEFAYRRGFKRIMLVGDLLEGNLRHHGFEFEVEDLGFDAQVTRLLGVLPEFPGLTYHFCCGNHEVNSYWKSIGMRPDLAIQRVANAEGRHDLIAAGVFTPAMESCYLLLNPGDPEREIKLELSHTSDKKAYALTYHLQKHVEGMIPGSKPHVLVKGHLHSLLNGVDIRGVNCFMAGCYKGQGSWERSKNMQPTIGSILCEMRHNGQHFEYRSWPKQYRPAPKVWAPVAA